MGKADHQAERGAGNVSDFTSIEYKNLIKSIMAAREKLEEYGSRPNVIVINEHKYPELKLRTEKNEILTVCGLEIKYADLPDNIDFYIPQKG